MDATPVMVYGEDVTHVVTEHGVAYLYTAQNARERTQLLACVAQGTPLGDTVDQDTIDALRGDGRVALPKDLDIDPREATRACSQRNRWMSWSNGPAGCMTFRSRCAELVWRKLTMHYTIELAEGPITPEPKKKSTAAGGRGYLGSKLERLERRRRVPGRAAVRDSSISSTPPARKLLELLFDAGAFRSSDVCPSPLHFRHGGRYAVRVLLPASAQ